MSWKFAGINFERDYGASFTDLLDRLKVEHFHSTGGFTFSEAIGRHNQGTALGVVNGKTMLLDHLLPYDCTYEPGRPGRLDELLRPLSLAGDILNYIVDGVSGTYCFSLFRQGERVRRWATEPGNVWCDDGQLVAGEVQLKPGAGSPAADEDSGGLLVRGDEARLFAVWEAFLGLSFQELVNDERPLFTVYD